MGELKTVWLYNEDQWENGPADRSRNIHDATERAVRLSVLERVPFFVAASDTGYAVVGRIGHVDAEAYPVCIGLAFDGDFISA